MEVEALNVGAVFIIFAVSGAGTMVPFISKKLPFCRANSIVMEAISAFSFGVVIATGLIHMVNEGIEKLSDEALGPIVDDYGSLGLAFVLITIVVMQLIECESAVFFGGKGSMLHGHSHGHSHGHGHGHAQSRAHSVVDGAQSSPESNFSTLQPAENSYQVPVLSTESHDATLRQKIATIIFETGVLFHSIVVGIDLGVTSGTEFKTLLTALCFHQFFEGVAIGNAAASSIKRPSRVLLMSLAFAVTTPIGQVIGLSIRNSYSSSSATSLWVEGILDCVAGGILLYTGLVELLTYNLTTNQQFLSRSLPQRFTLYACLWMGAALMALLGKWA